MHDQSKDLNRTSPNDVTDDELDVTGRTVDRSAVSDGDVVDGDTTRDAAIAPGESNSRVLVDSDAAPDEKWRRDQWAADANAPLEGEPKETWNRHQWASDNPGTSGDEIGVDNADIARDDSVTLNEVDTGTPDMTSISGRGKPDGESHFERNDPSE